MSDYFEFKLHDDGTVDCAENVLCIICHKSFAYYLQLLCQHKYETCGKLTKIND